MLDDWLANDPDVSSVGTDYLVRLVGMMATVGSVKSYAEKIRDAWQPRLMIEACEQMVILSRDPGQPLRKHHHRPHGTHRRTNDRPTGGTAVTFDSGPR